MISRCYSCSKRKRTSIKSWPTSVTNIFTSSTVNSGNWIEIMICSSIKMIWLDTMITVCTVDFNLFLHKYNNIIIVNLSALSTRIIERIFSGCVTKGASKVRSFTPATNAAKMSYTEFVWFLLSEEDKTHPTAVEYWFRFVPPLAITAPSLVFFEFFIFFNFFPS